MSVIEEVNRRRKVFSDAIGAYRIYNHNRVFTNLMGRDFNSSMHGFDHTCMWRVPKTEGINHCGMRRYERTLITTEPYSDGCRTPDMVIQFCKDQGLPFYVCQPGVGMWNPKGRRGIGTTLILIGAQHTSLDVCMIGEIADDVLSEQCLHATPKRKSLLDPCT